MTTASVSTLLDPSVHESAETDGRSFTTSRARSEPSHRELVRAALARYSSAIGLPALVRRHGSPLLVLDTSRVREQLDLLRRELPDARIHFATKALPHPAVIRTIAATGASFEVASRGEIALLRENGVDLSGTLHTHPIRTRSDIGDAYGCGIRRFVVDNPGELSKIAELPHDVDVLVRLSFPNPDAGCDLSAKFGATERQAAALVGDAIRHGVRVAGFSFHVGSQTTSVAPFEHAIQRSTRLMDELEARFGLRFHVIDLGGGFPIGYDEAVPELAALATGIRTAIAVGGRNDTVLLEPGRFVTATAMTLVTRVVGSSDRVDGRWHYLDDGLYGSYSNVLTEGVHPLVFAASELTTTPDAASERVTLAGPTCDSVDVIARGIDLPVLGEGDLLVSPMMGAYTSVTASGFNGLEPTRIHVISGTR
ncbi:type III PLP-dependent enzyme [Leifsonia sp. Leaf264]|uniref:type III PLP-dependent enzyme n=1 Tax=Leifsonia sp. Leaf264 TaxID=1736314 RepID=UPI0009EAC2DE|nr:type III PLP-dependent enzyme [Leifsonia sp. Leaf264]